jgi:hypothetical protein
MYSYFVFTGPTFINSLMLAKEDPLQLQECLPRNLLGPVVLLLLQATLGLLNPDLRGDLREDLKSSSRLLPDLLPDRRRPK